MALAGAAAIAVLAGLTVRDWQNEESGPPALPDAIAQVNATRTAAADPYREAPLEPVQSIGAPPPERAASRGSAAGTERLLLFGTLAYPNPRVGAAMLGATPESAEFYAVNEKVQPGVQLREIYVDHVIVERAGAREVLFIAWKQHPGVATAAAAPSTVEPAAVVRHNRGASIVSGDSVYEGQTPGFRVYAGRDHASFARLGLRPGDILTAVDDMPVAGDVAAVTAQLADLQSGDLTVLRGGQLQHISVQPAATVADAPAIPAPAPGQPGPDAEDPARASGEPAVSTSEQEHGAQALPAPGVS